MNNISIICDLVMVLIIFYNFYSLINFCKSIYQLHVDIEKHNAIKNENARDIINNK